MTDKNAVKIAEWEQHKAVYWKMGIDIEGAYKRQAWEAMQPIANALAKQGALKTVTRIEVTEG